MRGASSNIQGQEKGADEMKQPKRGDIFFLELSPSKGREMKGPHPALVIQNDVGNRVGGLTIVAAITSNLKVAELPVGVVITPEESGILRIPEVPDEIRGAVNNGTLAVFLGAGVSRLVGCEGWAALAKRLVKRCHKEGIINYREEDTLSQIQDHKKAITICNHLFHNNRRADFFYEEMNRALREGDNIEIPNIYDGIYSLRGLFITTNADTHFDRLFNPPNILYHASDFREDRLDSTNLYHIHGSVRDRKSLIFTVGRISEILRHILDISCSLHSIVARRTFFAMSKHTITTSALTFWVMRRMISGIGNSQRLSGTGTRR